MTQFENLGLSPAILKSLPVLGFETPTPIQAQAIPLVLAGHDVMGLAQTGTGKTAAFGLPLVHHLLKGNELPKPKSVRSLILAPTRELVNQIADNLMGFVRRTPLKVNSVVGGKSINMQIKKLHKGTDVLVATPGRLLDLIERKAVYLDAATFLVLDEADQMLDLGFIHALRKIAKLVGTPRQTMLFSATMPKQVEELSRAYLNDPIRVEVSPSGKAADKVRQSVHFIDQKGKIDLLKDCLIERRDDLSLVFARTKHGAEKLMKNLVASGFKAASIHGNKSQGQRDRAIKAFRDGDIRVLVATDVAARGIDIPGVSHVYNYDLPEVPENYVHRIGRTARAGAGGEAVAFCPAEDIRLLRDIERLMGIEVDVASGEVPQDTARPKRGGRGGGGGGNRNRPQNRKAPGKSAGRAAQSNRKPKKRHKKRADNQNAAQDIRQDNRPTAKATAPEKKRFGEKRARRGSKPGGRNTQRPGKKNKSRAA